MGKISIVGLGPGAVGDLTLKTVEIMENADTLFLRTKIHPTVDYIDKRGIKYKSFDEYYDKLPSFEEVYNKIAEEVIDTSLNKDIVYAVPGNPLVAEDSVQLILDIAKKRNIETEVFPSVSFIDSCLKVLSIDPIGGLKILDGLQIGKQGIDTSCHNIITQVYNKKAASDIKLYLMDYYYDETLVTLIRGAGIDGLEKVETMQLYEIDRVGWIDHLTSLYVPPIDANKKKRYDFRDLVNIMAVLRGEGGCPWDREQTHGSLKECMIEECYEVLEAIDVGDTDMLVEELGDVLLQVVFHSAIAEEKGDFDILDVTNRITQKMIERHPHIFNKDEDVCLTSEEVLDRWDIIKKKEQNLKTTTDRLKHIPKNMPALMRSYKVQHKASQVGFDWDSVSGVIDKVYEEIQEVEGVIDVYNSENYGKIIEELGDLLFAVVNVCRFLKIQPEFALNSATQKFINRFEYMENKVIESGKKMEDMTIEQLEGLWEKAKMNNF
jgi:tetrapyrrole methylase family protein/MazG family protein